MGREEIAYLRRKAAQFRELAREYAVDGDSILPANMEEIAREMEARAEALQRTPASTSGMAAKLEDIFHGIAARHADAEAVAYRVFFFDQERKIVGRDEFTAPSDAHAMIIAQTLHNASSDCCASFELWQGTRRVDAGFREGYVPRADWISEQVHEIVFEREIALLESRWAIADSARLLDETARLLERR